MGQAGCSVSNPRHSNERANHTLEVIVQSNSVAEVVKTFDELRESKFLTSFTTRLNAAVSRR